MEKIVKLIAKNTDRNVEFNFHMDDCKPHSCEICQLECSERLHPFKKKVDWTVATISQVSKHNLENNA